MIAEPILRLATSVASPAGRSARLSTFIFHRVLAQPDPMLPDEPDARVFDTLLAWIGSQFNVLEPLEACERLTDGTLPARAATITFDDGYRDNHDVALELLRRHRMPAAVFVATGYLNGGAMFNDRVIEALRQMPGTSFDAGWLGLGHLALGSIPQRRQAVSAVLSAIKHKAPDQRLADVDRLEHQAGVAAPTELMMSDAQVRALHDAGIQIGGHTRTHPILRVVDDADAEREIREGAADLNAITGRAPVLFAYPNGRPGEDFEPRHAAMAARAGFRFAFTTRSGAATGRSDPLQLPRFTPWDRDALRFRARMLRNFFVTA